MNLIEKRMLEILEEGQEKYGYLAVKAEFEAEGTRTDELLRLLELSRRANLKVGLKIGGCEAVRDLIESKQFGVEYIIAPMVETSYALSKFIEAKEKVYSEEERKFTQFLYNIETLTAFENRQQLFETGNTYRSGVDGAVFGRVDYSMSKKMSRDDINTQSVTNDVKVVAELCKSYSCELVVGGGVSIDAIDALREIREIKLDRFETRKIIFDGSSLTGDKALQGLINAVEFELLWLKNKREYYSSIFMEDDRRITMLEDRWKDLIGS